MNLKFLVFPITTLSIISIVGCRKHDPVEVQNLRWLEKADPIADAKKALSTGDHRLRAVYGLGVTIPGTDLKDFESLKHSYGIHEIAGTTDALINEDHHRLVLMAIKYSEAYNQHIITAFKPQARS